MRYPIRPPELRILILRRRFLEGRGETRFKIYTIYIPKAVNPKYTKYYECSELSCSNIAIVNHVKVNLKLSLCF
jgi:hypothetical protein